MAAVRVSVKGIPRHGLRLKAVQLFSLAETDLARVISQVENDTLFPKIRPFVRRLPFQPSRFHLPPFDETATPAGHDPIPWSEHQHELELIRGLGHERFQRYFLSDDHGLGSEQISVVCGLSPAEVVKIGHFLTVLSLQSHASISIGPAPGQSYTCIAKVAMTKGKPEILWTLPQLARGRYRIDYDGLRDFQSAELSRNERIRLKDVLRTLEFINLRHNALWRVLQTVLDHQSAFLKTGRPQDLKALTAAELSRKLDLHPSTIGRIAQGRSLLMPWGEERALDSFLPNRRKVVILALEEILSEGNFALSDEELRRTLRKRFRIGLSRRTVNECRREAMKASLRTRH